MSVFSKIGSFFSIQDDDEDDELYEDEPPARRRASFHSLQTRAQRAGTAGERLLAARLIKTSVEIADALRRIARSSS